MTRPFSWRVLLPGILFAAALAVVGGRMRPPAPGIQERCVTIVVLLLGTKLVAWVAEAGDTFAREQRLATFASVLALAVGWVSVRQSIAEAAFDYVVHEQRADLADRTRALAYRLDAFVQARRRAAPPAPRPDTWESDEAAFSRFETETILQYERRFGPQVRAAHDLLTLRGLGDRDVERFYRRPASEFQMRVLAERLAFMAGKLDEQNHVPH